MTTKSKKSELPEANIVDGKCQDCGASVPVADTEQGHEKTPQHQIWLEKVTEPEPVEHALPDEWAKLPQNLQEALHIMDDLKAERDIKKRMQQTAKQVRAIYAAEGWSDGYQTPSESIPQTVKGFLERFRVPILEDLRVIDRYRDSADPFRSIP